MGNQFIGFTDTEIGEMLKSIGSPSVDALYEEIVPANVQFDGKLAELGPAKAEIEVAGILRQFAAENTSFDQSARFLGGGHYPRVVPEAIHGMVWRGEYTTPYTPYQPEGEQGSLWALMGFQSGIAKLTGMEVVNAGVYNGSYAVVEAALMACRLTRRSKILVSGALNPVAAKNLETYFSPKGIELVMVPTADGATTAEGIEKLVDDKTAGVIIQNPNFWGLLDGMGNQAEAIHSKGAMYILAGLGDQISLALLKKPSDFGVDIYAGEGQHLGMWTGYGGPHVGPIGIRSKEHVRQLPGRLVIRAEDSNGKEGYVLGLTTREQHIRRENATSNICTAESLIAIQVFAYLSLMGPRGLQEAARQSYQNGHYLASQVSQIPGFELAHPQGLFFNEFAVRTPIAAANIVDDLAKKGVLAGVPVSRPFPYSPRHSGMQNVLLISATEVNNLKNMDKLLEGLNRYAAVNRA